MRARWVTARAYRSNARLVAAAVPAATGQSLAPHALALPVARRCSCLRLMRTPNPGPSAKSDAGRKGTNTSGSDVFWRLCVFSGDGRRKAQKDDMMTAIDCRRNVNDDDDET
ncbi:hypothetical protein GGX14DRAFT_642637 [Mycena pura]|uniref:Uncharacterized protein n=1 Tax=Mycena pura TaxID=153505 RepID=A0AAD6YR35_9AGAR|nr:hypothetical protein GGX14DRAFT_642637 [Mycena pura]